MLLQQEKKNKKKDTNGWECKWLVVFFSVYKKKEPPKLNWNTRHNCSKFLIRVFFSLLNVYKYVYLLTPQEFSVWRCLEIQFISSFVCSLIWWRLPYWEKKYKGFEHFVCIFFLTSSSHIKNGIANYVQVFFHWIISILIKKKQHDFFFNLIKENFVNYLSLFEIREKEREKTIRTSMS